MKTILWVISILAVQICSAQQSATPEYSLPKNNIGVTAGAPYILGLTYERGFSPKYSMQVHAGYFVYFQSAGLRLNYSFQPQGIVPYLFIGGTVVKSYAEDYGDPHGTTRYLWVGPGVSYSHRKFKIFLEVCALPGGNDYRGIGNDWIFPFDPAVGAGLLFRF